MALPGPGTFSSLSAKTACYSYSYYAGQFAQPTNVPYVDCNGFNVSIVVNASGSGTFCARSAPSGVGQVVITQGGNCPCITWYTRLYGAQNSATFTFAWLDCNGQPSRKIMTTSAGPLPGDISFYSCGNSRPVVLSGPLNYTLQYEAFGDGNLPPTYYCRRDLVG
jgi:hypothetical protein